MTVHFDFIISTFLENYRSNALYGKAEIEEIFKSVKLSSYYPQKILIQIYRMQKFVEFQEK